MNLTLEQKVDRVIQLLEGEPDAPGVIGRLARVEQLLFGDARALGMHTKVTLIWRGWIWLLCTMSAAAGYWLKTVVEQATQHTLSLFH